MCNLYSSARSQDEIRRTFAVDRDETGNLPPLPGVFPDQMAPVVHAAEGERVLTMMQQGSTGNDEALADEACAEEAVDLTG